jgi:hypothetical protein
MFNETISKQIELFRKFERIMDSRKKRGANNKKNSSHYLRVACTLRKQKYRSEELAGTGTKCPLLMAVLFLSLFCYTYFSPRRGYYRFLNFFMGV